MSEEINKADLQTMASLLQDEIKVLEEANQKAEFRSQDIRQIVLATERIGVVTTFAIKRLNRRVEKFLKIPKDFD